MNGLAHLDAETLGFVGPGNDTSVIITEHYNRLILKVRAENTLTGGVEVVTVNEGNSVHAYFVLRNICSPLVTTPLTSRSILSVISIGGYLGFPASKKHFLLSG